MKPVSFENGELLGKKGKSVELGKGEKLVILKEDEIITTIRGLQVAARADRKMADQPSRPHFSSVRMREFADRFDELAQGFQKVEDFEPK